MRRGGDDELLAISPPPEFQDNPSVPPPVLFQDLSPAGNTEASRKNIILKSQAVQNSIREFADKVSYNILNEAMIIATLIPSAGINDVRSQASSNSSSYSISSGASYSSNSVSTGTSWEYLDELHLDIPCLPPTTFRSPKSVEEFSSRRKSSRQLKDQQAYGRLKKSISDAFSYQFTDAGMNSGDKERKLEFSSASTGNVARKRSLDKAERLSSRRTCDDEQDGGEANRSGASSNSNNINNNDTTVDSDDVDVCYNVPFRCDIYSLPVDSIQSSHSSKFSEAAKENKNKPSTSSRRSHGRRAKKSNAENRVPGMGTCEGENNSRGRNNSRKKEHHHHHQSGARQTTVHLVEEEEGEEEVEKISNSGTRLSEQNNNENLNEGKVRSNKKRRSVSVEDGTKGSAILRKISQCTESQSSQLEEFDASKGKRNFGHTLLNLFKRNRPKSKTVQLPSNNDSKIDSNRQVVLVSRALPPPPTAPSFVPLKPEAQSPVEPKDFSASIAKVKDCGWYWGPLASDEAEDLLRGEPDGSFIVRDSSDVHYIFSLTFKLNGLVRHVRIEHDQGNFSFGPLTRFKAATIVEFVEKAVAHSRSGRYLFFLHRRPVLGPMQVQLLHPYSRFRHPRSLQHMCRFVILKYVRRDLLNTLPLPKPLQDYLNTPTNYYFEQQELNSRSNQ